MNAFHEKKKKIVTELVVFHFLTLKGVNLVKCQPQIIICLVMNDLFVQEISSQVALLSRK